ncbi:hypothetical protein ASE67_17225 [Sphingomonas sp. Leaf23]|nr:hypothetical protein ASE67_17225 [Sphingomonas sp. Leaf23]
MRIRRHEQICALILLDSASGTISNNCLFDWNSQALHIHALDATPMQLTMRLTGQTYFQHVHGQMHTVLEIFCHWIIGSSGLAPLYSRNELHALDLTAHPTDIGRWSYDQTQHLSRAIGPNGHVASEASAVLIRSGHLHMPYFTAISADKLPIGPLTQRLTNPSAHTFETVTSGRQELSLLEDCTSYS